MKIVTHISEVSTVSRCGLTIGNFDGLHRGHQKFIENFVKECSSRNLTPVVLSFIPHPLITLQDKKNFLINTYYQRRDFLKNLDIKFLVEKKFSRDFSTMSASNFLDEYIFKNKNVSYLYLGHDFTFGSNKGGNEELVDQYCQSKNIEYFIQKEFECEGNQVSSSNVRKALTRGKMKLANTLLGREFFREGLVVKGEGKGKTIGFPTANITFDDSLISPKRGVYITQTIIDGGKYNSVTNVGLNPTFNERDGLVVETHLLDFDNDIYGEKIKVIFHERVRDEIKFDSVNDLISQIKKDIKVAEKYFE